MIARGYVQNGVVVLADGFNLEEGDEVTVITAPTKPTVATLVEAHSLLDIAPVRVGAILPGFAADNDLLGEMLEDHR
jgi:hypothetical protein